MLLKASLHFHIDEDPMDIVKYSFKEAVDYLAKYKFDVLAITGHKKQIFPREYFDYASSKGILLIPGIELNLQRKHTVVLNADNNIEEVKTYESLRNYKRLYPKILVLAVHPFAPHPFLVSSISLGRRLIKNIDLFDAIEITWFHSKLINPNMKAILAAKKFNLPLLATADAHFLDYAATRYCEIEAKEKTIPAVLKAIKENKIKNYSPCLGILEYFLAYFKFNGRKNPKLKSQNLKLQSKT